MKLQLQYILMIITLGLLACQSQDLQQLKIREYPQEAQWDSIAPGIQRYVVQVGQGVTIEAEDAVEVHYLGWYTDQTPFYNSIDLDKSYRFKLGRGRVIPAWEKSLVGLSRGTQVYIKSDHHNAFGDGRADGLRSFVDVVFGVYITD